MSEYQTFTERAQALGRQGFYVFPGQESAKGVAKGYNYNTILVKATKDPSKIEEQWNIAGRNNNPVVACGERFGYLAVDIDQHTVDGMESIRDREREIGPLPEAPTVRTVNGGEHRYFKYPAGKSIGREIGILPGVDVMGNGAWMMGAGSYVDDSKTGRKGDYIWMPGKSPDDIPMPELPPEWINLFEQMGKFSSKGSGSEPESARFILPETITECRNNTLYAYACSLRGKGVPEDELASRVLKANTERCVPPLPEDEVKRTIRSALRHPPGTSKGRSAQKERLSVEAVRGELSARNMKVRLNDISQEIEITGPGGLVDMDDIVVVLHDHMGQTMTGVTIDTLGKYLSFIARQDHYNPVLALLSSAKWDGVDRLPEVFRLLGIEHDILSQVLVCKWLMQNVCLLFNDKNDPFGADGCLVLKGEQGTGKTSFFRHLALKSAWFGEGCSIDDRDKDTTRRIITRWISELGEVESTLKSDISKLKAFVTNDMDYYRLPYGASDIKAVRRTSLCATCNSDRYLIDTTGNRRWWTVPLLRRIPHAEIEALDALQLWAQIYAQISVLPYAEKKAKFRLSPEEQEALAKRNGEYEKPIKSQPEVEDILAQAYADAGSWKWEFMTISEFKEQNPTLRMYSAQQIGTVLSLPGLGIESKIMHGMRVKRLPKRKFDRGMY